MDEAEEVGEAKMAVGGEWDTARLLLTLPVGERASVGVALTNRRCQSVRIVVLDAGTDGVLAQSDDLPVKLGI